MPPEDPPNGRATVAQLYEVVNGLRQELRDEMRELTDAQNKRFDEISRLLMELREDFVSQATFAPFREDLRIVKEAVAHKADCSDVSDLKKYVYMGIGIALVVSLVAPPIIQHFLKG